MRKNFYFIMAVFFWLLMVIGFSDNWLFDVGQESNSNPAFLVHAFFAFSWFTFLVVQTGLIRKSNVKTHMKVGVAGMISYAGFFLVTANIYITRMIAEGFPAPLALMNMALFVFATLMIVRGFLVRKQDAAAHKTSILVGTFMLIEPALSRSLSHLFGGETEGLWLLTYLVLFGLFVWFYKKINWQITTAFTVWLLGTANFIMQMR